MGMPRDRKVVVGLGAVAVAGLMVDKLFLAPGDAAASPPAPSAPAATPAAPATAGLVTPRVESGIRDTMLRLFQTEGVDVPPQLQFGPDPTWTIRAEAVPALAASEPLAEPAALSGGVLPGLSKVPTLSLIMPTRDGGLAVIDGHRLRPGEIHPDGYTLVAIQDRSVTIAMGGSTASLSLRSPGN